MEAQINTTACWISVARFCLDALGVPVPTLAALALQFQTNANSNSAMNGAGKPETVIEFISGQAASPQAYTCTSMTFPKLPDKNQLRSIYQAINGGTPVICELRSGQIAGFKHAVVLCEAVSSNRTLAFKYKDPARNAEANLPRTVTAMELFDTGFLYKSDHDADAMGYGGREIWTYSERVIMIEKRTP
jgi:hypothetical protein